MEYVNKDEVQKQHNQRVREKHKASKYKNNFDIDEADEIDSDLDEMITGQY